MTYEDVRTAFVEGGWPFLFTLMTVLGLAVGVFAALYRLASTVRARRARRRAARQAATDLATLRALYALPTINEPTKD